MLLVQATIAKMMTADGAVVFDGVHIKRGKAYVIDLDQITVWSLKNMLTGALATQQMVAIAEPGGGWLPLECLRVHRDDVH